MNFTVEEESEMIDIRIGAAPHDRENLYVVLDLRKAIGKVICDRKQHFGQITDPSLIFYGYSWDENGELVKGESGRYNKKKFPDMKALLNYVRLQYLQERDKDIYDMSQSSEILNMQMFSDGTVGCNVNGTLMIQTSETDFQRIEHARVTSQGLDVLMYDNERNNDMIIHLPKEALESVIKIIDMMRSAEIEERKQT